MIHRQSLSRTMFACVLFAFTVPAIAQVKSPPYKDPSVPTNERVRDLLARMTLEEKAAQLRSMWFSNCLLYTSPSPRD